MLDGIDSQMLTDAMQGFCIIVLAVTCIINSLSRR